MNGGGGQRRRKPRRSSGGSDKLEELDVTKEELDGIGEALKDEQFRKLLCEYAEEIADPANRAQREREMQLYELERGVRLTFVRPRPGFVVKTSADGERKVFVNICSDDAVAEPSCRPDAGGQRWSLPHCLSPVRRDYDRARKPCDVYDVVFHPRVLQLAGRPRFREMVEDTALSMVERTDSVALDRVNVKYPKNVSYKGVPRSLALRAPVAGFTAPADGDDRVADMPGLPPAVDRRRPVEHHDLGALPQKCRPEPAYAVPAYVIKYRSAVDMGEHGYDMHCKMNATVPNELVVEVKLPLLDTSAHLAMDVWPRRLKLVCCKPSRYALDVGLPYAVREEHGRARFDRTARLLTVVLPVQRTDPPLVAAGRGRPVEAVDGHPAADEEPCGDSDGTVVARSAVTFSAVEDDTVADTVAVADDDVHYSLPEHELTFGGGKCTLRLNAKNVDPTSVTVAYDAHAVSGKFQSIGSGFFPVWYAFCLEMPLETTIAPSDVRVLPSDDNVTVEFSAPDDALQQCRYGLPDRNRGLAVTRDVRTAAETRPENSTSLTNDAATVVSVVPEDDSDDDVDNNDVVIVNNNNHVDNNNDVDNNNNNDDDEDDDDDDDHDGKDGDDVFVDTNETAPSKDRQQNGKKKDGNYRLKNGKTTKETGKKKNRKKMHKSNAIPIAVADSLPETSKKVDFVPGSLPTEFNCTKPTIRGILKKRSLSECSNADDVVLSPRFYSSSVDNVDTESSDVQESSFNDSKKTVRFNDHVIEKKFNFNISIAAQAKKHRQRQQRKRNIREYSTPSESEASEAEDRTFGPLNVVSESDETSVSESSAGEMSDDGNGPTSAPFKVTVVADSKKDHKRRKSKSARKNASLAKQTSTNNLIFPIEY